METQNRSDILVREILPADFDQWLELWKGYNTFYKRVLPDEITRTTWARFFEPSEPVFCVVAEKQNTLVGLSHFLFHRNTTLIQPTCYLQDLFTSDEARNLGVGRALIEAVYERAKKAGSPRVYWQTHETNVTAMGLYNKVAERSGFLVYRKDLL